MTKSYSKDIQLLLAILRNQDNIKKVIERFQCNQNNLEKDQTWRTHVCKFQDLLQKYSNHECNTGIKSDL